MRTKSSYDTVYNRIIGVLRRYCNGVLLSIIAAAFIFLVGCSQAPSGNARLTPPKSNAVADYLNSSKLPWHIAALTSGVLFYRSKSYGKLKRKVVAALKAK